MLNYDNDDDNNHDRRDSFLSDQDLKNDKDVMRSDSDFESGGNNHSNRDSASSSSRKRPY